MSTGPATAEVDAYREYIHAFFGLSYANYLVLPRTLLQSMPAQWQARFVSLIREMDDVVGKHEDNYEVRLRGDDGKYKVDPLEDYERGRRRIGRFAEGQS